MSYVRYLSLSSILLMGTAHASATVPPVSDSSAASTFDLMKVFMGCPLIYTLLIAMSLTALVVWLYSIITLRMKEMMPTEFVNHLRSLISEKRFEAALAYCKQDPNFCSQIMTSGINARKHGPQVMMDAIQSEGRRRGNSLWQRISLLNEIAVLAPMVGLLGTVIGLFFAFYDSNRSAESIASIFDGLGIAVGTTVVGLVVAILSMIFYTTLKYRVVNLLNSIENESMSIISLVEVESTSDQAYPSQKG